MKEVLVVISGERGTERIEAVAETQEQVNTLFEERGVAKGVNSYFPDDFWGEEESGLKVEWKVIKAPFLSSAQS